MQTTFTLDDDAAALAQTYAKARSLRMGQAVSEPIRRASAQHAPITLQRQGKVWVYSPPPGSPVITSEQVKDLLNDLP